MAITMHEFIHAHRFLNNPFTITNAVQEEDRLSSFFVQVPWFDRLVGDPTRPESFILFAPQGHGKTSHRLEVGRIGMEASLPALAVPFTSFDMLLDHASKSVISTTVYLPLIIRFTLEALLACRTNQRSQSHWESLCSNIDKFARFCALVRIYVPAPPEIDMPETTTVGRFEKIFSQVHYGAKNWLNELSQLAQAANFASINLLFDGLDEWTETRTDPDLALRILKPLLDAPGLLQECGVAFKFFLPESLADPMQQQRVGRLDRIPVYRLEWQTTDLVTMLTRRLSSYSLFSETSARGYVNAFQDLCADKCDADLRLARSANCSPRTMIDLARLIVERHCAVSNNSEELIKAETIATVIGADDEDSRSTKTQELLFFDQRGNIWLGNRIQASRLPKLLHLCMAYMWQHRHQIIHYQQLQQAIYGNSLPERGDARSSCDKLIRRLRARIEPENPDGERSHTYIAVQPGAGYTLSNFQDESV